MLSCHNEKMIVNVDNRPLARGRYLGKIRRDL